MRQVVRELVSIHAPVKVRPDLATAAQVSLGVSIHAPVKVRQKLVAVLLNRERFNPRTCEGATITTAMY